MAHFDLDAAAVNNQYSSFLAFLPTERPSWRSADAPSTSSMVDDIVSAAISGSLTHLPAEASSLLAAMYVTNSNKKMEMVGTSCFESTLELVQGAVVQLPEKQKRETINTLNGLKLLHQIQSEMVASTEAAVSTQHVPAGASNVWTGQLPQQVLLTTDIITRVHAEVLAQLSPAAGEPRTSSTAVTFTADGVFTYMPPHMVASAFQAWVDQHNHLVTSHFTAAPPDKSTAVKLFNLAAQQLLRFLTIHPFSDGNERMGRLLVNFMLRPLVPLPVMMTPPSCTREQYVAAVHSARHITATHTTLLPPSDLSAMIIEGAWCSMKEALRVKAQSSVTCRGQLYLTGPSVDAARYQLLQQLGLSAEEQAKEVEAINSAAAALWGRGAGGVSVPLQRGTHCVLFFVSSE